MNYRIQINKEKENAFLQLLRGLQSLGVVKDFERLEHKDKNRGEESENAQEVANQYRDLVD
jgi:hypothetical protein